jgi:hypothetical protein
MCLEKLPFAELRRMANFVHLKIKVWMRRTGLEFMQLGVCIYPPR